MNTFASLLQPQPGELPGDTQRRAHEAFPARLAASQLDAWAPSDVAASGSVLVIGAATWSPHDLRLLDLLNSPTRSASMPVRVAVFDVDACPAEELPQRVPLRVRPLMNPVVGWWQDGRLVEAACGFAGRTLVYRVLGLERERADEFIFQRPAGAAV